MFLKNEKKLEILTFFIFLTPGTPKDALTYIAPIAPISPIKYLLIATFARIPSIITSTLLGDSIAEGNWILAVIVFAITAAISIAGIVFGNKFIENKQKKKEGFKTRGEALEFERDFLNKHAGSPDITFGNLIERYMLYVNWDMDVRGRLAGGKPDS